MITRAAIAFALGIAALALPVAHAQLEPTPQLCEGMAALRVASLNFETQDVTAPLWKVVQAAEQVSGSLDQLAEPAMRARPAAFDQLKVAHEGVEAVINAVPRQATAAQVQSSIADAKESERVAYQNFTGSIVCP